MIQYAKYRRPELLKENRPRALLIFAGDAILDSVRERRRRWTWAFFAERRDDRRRYVEVFKKKKLNTATDEVRLYSLARIMYLLAPGIVGARGLGEKAFV